MNRKRNLTLLAGMAFLFATSSFAQETTHHAATATSPSAAGAIRPFHVHISDAQIHDLPKRLAETRLPGKLYI